jgi:hypothetical protein
MPQKETLVRLADYLMPEGKEERPTDSITYSRKACLPCIFTQDQPEVNEIDPQGG